MAFWFIIGFLVGAVCGAVAGTLVYRNNAKIAEARAEALRKEANDLKARLFGE